MKKHLKKKYGVKKSVKRTLVFGSLSIASVTFIGINISETFIQIINKKKEAVVLEETLKDLKENENDLSNEVLKLQDPEYLARYAREKYFYSKDGEIIIRIPEK